MPTLILFDYLNHNGEDHKYLVRIGPSSLVFDRVYQSGGDHQLSWHLKGEVLKRDGEARLGFRSFQLSKIRELEEVPDA